MTNFCLEVQPTIAIPAPSYNFGDFVAWEWGDYIFSGIIEEKIWEDSPQRTQWSYQIKLQFVETDGEIKNFEGHEVIEQSNLYLARIN